MLPLIAAIALQAAAAGEAPPEPPWAGAEDNALVVLCDPIDHRFSIRIGTSPQAGDAGYPERTEIHADTLHQLLPGWAAGQDDIRGPLIRYVRCGPYTMRLKGDAYNASIQGESGAMEPFAAVEVIRANRLVYASDTGGGVRFTECDRELPRARPCPEGYAVRLDGAYDPQAKALVMVETASSVVHNDPATTQVRSRTLTEADDLTLWAQSAAGPED